MRASTLKTYAGQAALPGGKADSLSETPFDTARREAYEEIGLPLSDAKLPPPFRVEHLCQLSANLARTELGVRPCVAFLSANPTPASSSTATGYPSATVPSIESTLIPRLDPKEVAAVFTAPFRNFLRKTDELPRHSSSASAEQGPGVEPAGLPAEWYRGGWTDWHKSRWHMHNFYVPVAGQTVTRPRPKISRPSRPEEVDPLDGLTRFRVFGMTARILVDAARVAYDEEPEFEHNAHFGDEDMIGRLLKIGRLTEKKGEKDKLTRGHLREAAKI